MGRKKKPPPQSSAKNETDSVVRLKLLDGAGVPTESPPSQHEQVFGLSQVKASVAEELQEGAKRNLKGVDSIRRLRFSRKSVCLLVT